MDENKKELAKVIEKYFGADAGYLDISCLDLARAIIESGWIKPVRCKNCKHYGRIKDLIGLRCDLQDNQIWCKDDFCSYGERREGE